MTAFIILGFLSYLVGSFPTGYWICRWWFGFDITHHGSGNIGATNVARILDSPKIFVLVFLLDALKAYTVLAVVDAVLRQYCMVASPHNVVLAYACMVLIGNAFSIFLGFKGGKGVATTVGLIGYVASFWLVVAFVVCWLIVLAVTKHAFMASLGAAYIVTALYAGYYACPGDFLIHFLLIVCFWLTLRHYKNIRNFLG